MNIKFSLHVYSCRDGLSRPPKRGSVSCPPSSIQAPEPRPPLKRPVAFNSHNTGGTLFPKSTVTAKLLVLPTPSLLSTEKRSGTTKKGETTDLIGSDSENLPSSDDESLPHPDEFFKHFGEICDEDVIVIEDSESRSQSMITDHSTELSPVLSKKRKSPAVTVSRQLKCQKLNDVSPDSPAISFNGAEATHPMPLFLPSSPFDRNETDFTIVSQTFTLDSRMDACNQFSDEKVNEKEECNDDDKQNHPLDGYARDYAELCAWLMDVAE